MSSPVDSAGRHPKENKRSICTVRSGSPSKSSPGKAKSPPKKWKALKKHAKSLSGRDTLANKRFCADSTPTAPVEERKANAEEVRPSSRSEAGSEPAAIEIFELPETSPRGQSTSRPRYVPIVIPEYVSLASEPSKPRQDSCGISASSGPEPLSVSFADPTLVPRSEFLASGAPRPRPRHVEIQIPAWAEPVLTQPLRLTASTFIDPFASVPAFATFNSSRTPAAYPPTDTMESNPSRTSPPNQLYANHSNSGSRAQLPSAKSSQSSLVGLRAEYESASEAESNHDEPEGGSHTPSQPVDPSPAPVSLGVQTQSGVNTSNLSGLLCNVHRTTGKEPHPLVGASTTILGDKLYVFGGRRSSSTKPQMTSTLYELDLVRRHWTKLEAKGDVPPARYFHSMCALGDTKLVCYGGMSPAPVPEMTTEGQSGVVVMSDIHIFDVPTLKWTKINTAGSPQGRYAHCAAILPSSAVFASSTAPLSAIHHNPSGVNPNQGTLGVAIDGTGGAEMVVVGGQDSANHYIEQVSVFNLRSLKWTGTTGMGRSCGAYRSVVTPLTSLRESQIGAGPYAPTDDDDDDESGEIGSGAPLLIYSNYNFLDVKLELQLRLTDGTLTEKPMQTGVSPPGLRFPNGGVIADHFVVSGTFLNSSKHEYALWALDLRTLTWSRIDAGGSIFSQGSWNRGVLWSRRNAFVILGNRKRSLVDDYHNRRINFTNICIVELEAFGLYDNPRRAEPTSNYVSASAGPPVALTDTLTSGRALTEMAEDLGAMSLGIRQLADMEFLAMDGTRIPVSSRLISRRWGAHFTNLLRESLVSAAETDTATLRPSMTSAASRNSSITITPSLTSNATTLTNNTSSTTTLAADIPDTRTAPPHSRPRLFFLPHKAATIHALLHYLYTSTLPAPPSALATPQIFCSLLQLARPYKIDGLLEAVVERLHECLDGRNAAAIFNAAAMAAGGGEGVQFTSSLSAAGGHGRNGSVSTAVNAAAVGSTNGVTRSAAGLRIDTDMANGRSRSARRTLRPAGAGGDAGTTTDEEAEEEEDEIPMSAATDTSMSESETSFSARDFAGVAGAGGVGRGMHRDREIWNGALSSVVGLQKRGLRGLMEGRRMRDRGRSDGVGGSGSVDAGVGGGGGGVGGRVGLGIA